MGIAMGQGTFDVRWLLAALPLGAYLLGAVPWGIVWTRLFSAVDITRSGSRNIGATNVSRVAGIHLGVLTLTTDVAKGALSVGLALKLAGFDSWGAQLYVCGVALAAFGGHLLPVYMGFKRGGKGVATAAGCFALLSPAACGLALLVFAVVLGGTRRVSAGSLAAALALTPAAWGFSRSWPLAGCALIMAAAIVVRHRDNIQRLRRGNEPGVGERDDRPAS